MFANLRTCVNICCFPGMGQESTWLHQFRDYDRDLQDLQGRAVNRNWRRFQNGAKQL